MQESLQEKNAAAEEKRAIRRAKRLKQKEKKKKKKKDVIQVPVEALNAKGQSPVKNESEALPDLD